MTGRPPGSRNRPVDRKAALQARKAYARALRAMEAAREARREAVANMVAAGMTLRDIGEVLGVSHVAVLGILRSGVNGTAGDAPEVPAGADPTAIAAGADPTAIAAGADPTAIAWCVRAGCEAPANEGGRLCPAHLYN